MDITALRIARVDDRPIPTATVPAVCSFGFGTVVDLEVTLQVGVHVAFLGRAVVVAEDGLVVGAGTFLEHEDVVACDRQRVPGCI